MGAHVEYRTLELRNPHSVLAVLQRRPHDVLEISYPPGGGTAAWQTVHDAAAGLGAGFGTPRRSARSSRRAAQAKVQREGGGWARVRAAPTSPLEELLSDAPQRAGGCGLWLALDCIQDPHNLGAIVRTAAFFGVQGMILTSDRAAPLSPVVYDTASGGMEHLPFTVQVNLSRALELAKSAGVWILGTSEHADLDISRVPRDRPWLLVIGNEATGMRRLTAEHCDTMCAIRPRGGIRSLNASVAAGILIANLASSAGGE